ncbi:hypothetical protein LWI29_007759 [Acer saccharum]|uniref:PGG domain-containing protein n=1 Tax=Acer saccharum TaxID=4024 RepID=A0AA39SDB7_ACESA|nr:hypothetical protein LWI29_007759 [Acer saccharum]
MLEAGVTADLFFNPDWEEDFPEDPSGSFTQFKEFIRSNFEICKWIGLSIVSVQGVSFLLALMLKALGPHQYYDTDDEYAPDRVPLLKNAVHPPTYVVGDPVCGSRTDAWTIRVNDKGHSATSAHTCTGDGNAMVACAGLPLKACQRKLRMEPVHFEAALNGDVNKFPFCDIEREDLSEIFNKVSPSGNSLLHVASSSGHEEMTQLIACNFPFLITKQNYEGNTALHLAVRAHKLNTVRILVILSKQNPNTSTDTLLTMKNDDGNTALHEALFALHASKKNVNTLVDLACYLVLIDPNVSCHQNNAGKSPLCMAVESGNKYILEYILNALPRGDALLQRLQGKSPVHVAIEHRKLDMLRIIKEEKEELLLLPDEEGNTPLHFAACMGFIKEVRYLLEIKSGNCAFERNNKGFYPLHLACENGHIQVTKELFRKWPDPTELLCNKSQSILHVAAKSGKENVVRYLLKEKCTDKLVNKMDKNGNTPFHLAALHGHSMVVVALMRDKRSNIDILNHQGLTAYDIFKSNVFSKDQQIDVNDRNLKASGVKENSVEVDLKNSEKPKQFLMMMTYSMLYMYLEFFPRWRITRHHHISTKISSFNKKLPIPKQDVNNTINNLFVVAALIVGAAFAGVLQIPYDGEKSTGEGFFLDTNKVRLSFFLFYNITTMSLSVIAAFTLFLALSVDNNLATKLVSVAFLLLELALTFMGCAFLWAMMIRIDDQDGFFYLLPLETTVAIFQRIQLALVIIPFLTMVNSVIGMVGIAMILYALWLIRVWEIHMGHFPPAGDHPVPWFIYTFLGLGVILCVITCSGHIAAETANGCCLYLYMFFVILLLMLEAGVTADVFFNPDWEEDFPEDPSGSFTQFKEFIRSNFETCKWIGLSIVSVQGVSFLLALMLKALGPHQYYDSDDEYAPDRVPLLKNAVLPPTYVVGDPVCGSRTDAWTIRVNDKVSR